MAECPDRERQFSPRGFAGSSATRSSPHGISHYEGDHPKACKAFEPFRMELLKHLEYEGMPFIIDAYHVMPESLVDLKDRYGIVFLGYPSADPQEKFRANRAYARPQDWTEELSDGQLRELVTGFIEESRALENACKEFDIPFIDTSCGFEQAIQSAFEALAERIEREIE